MLIVGSVQAAGENAKLPVGLFCRDAASGSACGSGRVREQFHPEIALTAARAGVRHGGVSAIYSRGQAPE